MTIKDLIPIYLTNMKALGRSYYTIRGARYTLRDFIKFLEEGHAFSLEDLTPDILEEYRQDLAFRLTAKGLPLSIRSQAQMLGVVLSFTRFLKEKDYLLRDPGDKIERPKKPQRLPKSIMSPEEVKKILHAPDMRTNTGYRNRIMVEILYDTAIRRSELASIKLADLDLDDGYILIHGKGDKDRVVPLSKRVSDLTRSYILAVRPSFLHGNHEKDEGHLILNRWGEKMTPNAIWAVVKKCACLARLKKNISTHTFRHTCATHMLKNGAPVRHLQEMLGHASLESTQIYTHVTINDLKEIHAKYHPGEKMESQ